MASLGAQFGLDVAGSVIDSGLSALSARQNYKYAQRAAEDQYRRQLEFWDLQNKYNDPKNSYKRLVEGLEANGLNKALALGNGAQPNEAGALSSVPGNEYAQSGVLPSGALSARLTNPLDFELKQAQIDDLKASAEEKRANANKTVTLLPWQEKQEEYKSYVAESDSITAAAKADIAKIDKYIAEQTKDTKIGLSKQELANAQAEWDKAAAAARKLNAEALGQEIDNETAREKNQLMLQQMYMGLLVQKAQIAYAQAGTQLTLEQVNTEKSKQGLNAAEISEIAARVELLNQDKEQKAEMFIKELEMAGVQLQGAKFDNHWLTKTVREFVSVSDCALDWAAAFYTGGLSTTTRAIQKNKAGGPSTLIQPSRSPEKMPTIYQ